MPELPEVETIKNFLKQKVIGKTIKKIIVKEKKQLIGNPNLIVGKKIFLLSRYGKVLSIQLSDHSNKPINLFLNFHLKLTGQLLFANNLAEAEFKETIPFTKTKKMPGPTTRIIIEFTDRSGLFFNDLRKFGWLKISSSPERPKGLDILNKHFNLDYLANLTTNSRKPIKLLLMDQEKITGIGNIYANDSLFLAKIHPLLPSNQLSLNQVKILYQAIKKVIREGISHQGSSGADEAFILPDGTKGQHQRYFLVYQKENQPCPRCQTPIKRIKQNNRSSFFCPQCQQSP